MLSSFVVVDILPEIRKKLSNDSSFDLQSDCQKMVFEFVNRSGRSMTFDMKSRGHN